MMNYERGIFFVKCCYAIYIKNFILSYDTFLYFLTDSNFQIFFLISNNLF